LRELYVLLNSEEHKERINNFAIERRISWHFIPPLAPHFGSLWEFSVKSFKHHLKKVVGDSLFTFEELNTLIIEIEGILNSRPISFMSSDPNDLLVLSPTHFLIGKPITSLPDTNLTSVPTNRLSAWQHITKVRQDFWKRWNLEYLNELQMRNKWVQDGSKLNANTTHKRKKSAMHTVGSGQNQGSTSRRGWRNPNRYNQNSDRRDKKSCEVSVPNADRVMIKIRYMRLCVYNEYVFISIAIQRNVSYVYAIYHD